MNRAKILVVAFAALALAIGAVFLVKRDAPAVSDTKRLASKRPENFTEGVWIKKYPSNYACFKFETPEGVKIVCDPFNMDEAVEADIVTESHQHWDHVDDSKITGVYKLYKRPGEFIEKGVWITGIGGRHDKGDTDVTNTVFVFNIDGIKIAHFASQGQAPSEEMWAKLKECNGIDVMLVQAYTAPHKIKMTVDECCAVIDRLDPRIVIPEHGSKGISGDFARRYHTRVERIDRDGFVLTKAVLKSIKGHRILDMDYDEGR